VPPRAWLRAVAAAWLLLVSVALLALAAEAWLQFGSWRDARASERFGRSNVFFAHAMELQAGTHSLWRERWREYRPGARIDVVVGGERFVVEMNSRGYRTHEFAVPKPAGLVRVVCLGGSTTIAGRTNEETWPALVERTLRSRYPGLALEVLNLGVSSVTTEYWLERMGQVLEYEPDVVVQYQGVNDIAWRHLPRYAQTHRLRGWAYRSLLLQRLFPFPTEDLDPYLDETLETLGRTADVAHGHAVAYLGATFAQPDPERARGDFRRHLDHNSEFWTRRFPMHGYATWAGIVARYDVLYREFAWRRHVPFVPVHEQIDDPRLFIDVCHFTPEGIARVADVFSPAVAGLVEGTEAFAAWKRRGGRALYPDNPLVAGPSATARWPKPTVHQQEPTTHDSPPSPTSSSP
jgi:hypothetical protein